MKKITIAVVLMCALSTPIFAGDIPLTGVVGEMPTTGKSEPPPPPATTSSTSSTLVSVILTILSLR